MDVLAKCEIAGSSIRLEKRGEELVVIYHLNVVHFHDPMSAWQFFQSCQTHAAMAESILYD